MSAEKYRASEDAYFKLRGQFDTGRISQEQFDEKLRELMVQDAQGRYWMLGADSGKWYFYDGVNWVQGNPLDGAAAAAVAAQPTYVSPGTTLPAGGQPAYNAPVPAAIPEGGRGFPLVPILVGVAIVALAIAAFLLFQNRDRFLVAQQPPAQITPILPPTITRAPSPTPLNAATNAAVVPTVPTPIPQTEIPTIIPPTEVPATAPPITELPTSAITVVVVTTEPTATTESPTLIPTAIIQPTETATATGTEPPATATNSPPTNTPLPNVPPGVYVTALSIDPNPAFKNQNAAFTASFLNTTGGPRNFDSLVLLYDPNKTGQNNGFGESTQVPVSIPAGESTFTINHIPVKGQGGCVSLFARVGWKISAVEKPIFPNTEGEPVTVYFDVCPP